MYYDLLVWTPCSSFECTYIKTNTDLDRQCDLQIQIALCTGVWGLTDLSPHTCKYLRTAWAFEEHVSCHWVFQHHFYFTTAKEIQNKTPSRHRETTPMYTIHKPEHEPTNFVLSCGNTPLILECNTTGVQSGNVKRKSLQCNEKQDTAAVLHSMPFNKTRTYSGDSESVSEKKNWILIHKVSFYS